MPRNSNNDEIIAAIQATPEEPPPLPPRLTGQPDDATPDTHAQTQALLDLPNVGPHPQTQALLDLPNVSGADVSDPAGNKDARDRFQDEHPVKPSWFDRAMHGAPPSARLAYAVMQPGAAQQIVRRAVPDVAGIPGDLVDFAANKVPGFFGKAPQLPQVQPATSGAISKDLERAGWPDRAIQHPIADMTGSGTAMAIPVGEAAKVVASPVARKVGQVLADYGGGGKIGRDIDQFGREVTGTADMRRTKAIDDARAPDVKPQPGAVRQGAKPVEPASDWTTEGLPGTREKGRPAAPQDIDKEFEDTAFATKEGIKSEKQDIRSTMEWQRMTQKPEVDLEPIKTNLGDLIENSAGPGRKAALAARTHVEEIENIKDPVARFEQLDQLKRELAKRGGLEAGTDASGYAAISEKQSRALRTVIDQQLKEWAPFEKYTEGYAAAGNAEAKAKFLKSIGETEQGGSFMTGALRGPKNVALAKKALGDGGAEKFDDMASRYVVSQLSGKSAADIEKWGLQNEATLREIPQTAKTVFEMQRRADQTLAEQGLYKEALEKFETDRKIDQSALLRNMNAQQTQEAAEAAARETARSLIPSMTAVQVAKSPKEQASAIGGLIKDLHGKGMIDDAQYTTWAEQLSSMQKSASRQAALQTMAKYISYAVTGNYLVSFGGPAAAKYLAAAAK